MCVGYNGDIPIQKININNNSNNNLKHFFQLKTFFVSPLFYRVSKKKKKKKETAIIMKGQIKDRHNTLIYFKSNMSKKFYVISMLHTEAAST